MIVGDFEIVFLDKHDFEYLVAQVRWGKIVLCEISRKSDGDLLEVEMLCNDEIYNNQTIKFELAEFLLALGLAKKELGLM